nr:hypothetical protein [Tanacetum cinerariifolium]
MHTTTTLPLPPPLPQQSTSDSDLASRVAALKQKLNTFEQKNKTLDNTTQNLGSRVFNLELCDLLTRSTKLSIDQTVNTVIKEAVHIALQAPLRDRFRELPEADMKEILHQRMQRGTSSLLKRTSHEKGIVTIKTLLLLHQLWKGFSKIRVSLFKAWILDLDFGLDLAPRSPEYVPDLIELEDHVPLHIPEHPEDLVPAEDEAYILEVASAPTPPLPPSFLSLRIRPLHTRAAMAQMRAAVPSTYLSLLPLGTPPLLPIPLHVPSTSRRAEIPEADTPPWKRLLLTTPRPGCEVGESSAAEDRAAVRAKIELLRRERIAYEQKSIQIHKALTKSEAYSKTLESRVAVLETQANRYEWQRQTVDDFAVQHITRTQALEAGAGIDILEDTAACQVKYAACTLQGVILTWWNSHVKTVTLEVAQALPWKTLKKMMTDKYCPRGEIKKLETDMVEKYIGGLPNTIHDSVKASKPKTMQEAIEFATELINKRIYDAVENKRKQDDNNNQAQQQPLKKQGVAIAYTAGPGERNEYAGTLPLCNKCKFYHNGQCTIKCVNCKRVGHLTQDCRSPAATNNHRNPTCYQYGNQWHYRSDCPELKN